MRRSKLHTPKQARLQERNAERVLEEESERISEEFMQLFVSGGIREKGGVRSSAKIADWEDNPHPSHLQSPQHPPRYHYMRIATIENYNRPSRQRGKAVTEQVESRPTFSISLLSPKIQDCKQQRSQKLQKLRSKAASHLRTRFLQHLAASHQQPSKNRVHSLNSVTLTQQQEKRIAINFERFEREKANNRWLLTEKTPQMTEDTLHKQKKRVQSSAQVKCTQKSDEWMKEVVGYGARLKASKQFIRLRQLLSLQKI